MIFPRQADESLQGQILQKLLESAHSTSQLALHLRMSLHEVRLEVICLHHVGVIQPIGFRHEDGAPPARLYYRDYIWEITEHGLEHHDHHAGCRACEMRASLLLRINGYWT